MAAVIESPRNPRLVAARRLRHRRDGWLLAEGQRVVSEALRSGCDVDAVFVTPSAASGSEGWLKGAPVQVVSERAMKGLAETESPQGIVAVVRDPRVSLESLLARRPARVLVLADVRDPGNVGTALRAVEGAGFDAAVVCAGSCAPSNSKAVRASAGALFHLPHAAHVDAEVALNALKGWRRIGADPDGGTPLDELRSVPPLAVVIGNEASGLAPNLTALLDETVAIPMRGRVASLNAGVAAALVAYKVRA